MTWSIVFTRQAEKQLLKLADADRKRVHAFLELRVARREDPRWVGEQLSGTLKGYWKYRAGPYRILVEIHDHEVTVLVIRIGHRRDIYR